MVVFTSYSWAFHTSTCQDILSESGPLIKVVFQLPKSGMIEKTPIIISSRNCCCAFTSSPTTSLCILSAKIFKQWLFVFFALKGGCGSCWTFSTTGCLESVTAINKGKLLLLVSFFFSLLYKNCWFCMINTVPLSLAVMFICFYIA